MIGFFAEGCCAASGATNTAMTKAAKSFFIFLLTRSATPRLAPLTRRNLLLSVSGSVVVFGAAFFTYLSNQLSRSAITCSSVSRAA